MSLQAIYISSMYVCQSVFNINVITGYGYLCVIQYVCQNVLKIIAITGYLYHINVI